jgi:hypothetical protein
VPGRVIYYYYFWFLSHTQVCDLMAYLLNDYWNNLWFR